MTGDWVFDACVASIILSLVGVGLVAGYVWGFGRGIRWELRRKKDGDGWAHNNWQYLEQSKR